MEKVCFSCTEWHRTEENGEPRRFILNLPLDEDDSEHGPFLPIPAYLELITSFKGVSEKAVKEMRTPRLDILPTYAYICYVLGDLVLRFPFETMPGNRMK